MFLCYKNTPSGPPTAVWLGRTPQTSTQCPRLSAARPPCVVTGPVHTPKRGLQAGRISLLEATNRPDWIGPTLQVECGSSAPPRPLRSVHGECLRPDASTLGRGASVRQGVALDPARSVPAPLQTMMKGAVELPFKFHDRGDFALPWTPSPNPARVEMRGTCWQVHYHQRTGLGCGKAAA